MTPEEALERLSGSTAAAVEGVLQSLAPGGVERGVVTIAGPDDDPLDGIGAPAVVASGAYVDGAKGGNVFGIGVAGARRLAAAMMGLAEPAEAADAALTELELSAVSEAVNQMMVVVARATRKVLGREVEIGAPTTTLVENLEAASGLYERTPHVAVVSFSVFGESCRLVQLVPNAFVVRITRAFGERAGALLEQPARTGEVDVAGGDVLRSVSLRVWGELGRATMPVGRAVGLSTGSVVELDRAVDDAVDLYVNGRRFAVGRLLLDDDGEWAVRIEAITHSATAASALHEGVR